MRMTLRQLAVFVAVAQEGTVTKASDAVRLTQSAASMALADLEDGLGAPLFDRLGKRLQLNDLGRLPVSTGQFKCDGRTHCSQMRSYEEAVYFLRNCPNTQMDGNNDGEPCERQFGK